MKNFKNNVAKLMTVLSILFAFSSCKKDKDKESETNAGNYSYQGKTINILSGDYRSADEGTNIFLKGTATNDYVSFRFPRTGAYQIPVGTFQYSNLSPFNNLYNPNTNFNGGSISSDAVLLGDPMNGGKVTITKEGDVYVIGFEVTTAKGSLKGSFKGNLKKI